MRDTEVEKFLGIGVNMEGTAGNPLGIPSPVAVVWFGRVGRWLAVGSLLLGLLLGLGGCGVGSQGEVRILLASFAVTRDAYRQIIPAFEAHWLAQTGQRVRVESSYAGSATQARAVIDGLDADVVALALGLDVERLVAAGLVRPGWESRTPNQGIVTRSVAAIVTRQGNPHAIHSWLDLAQPGLQVITANPKTSGGARWNFLALWSAVPEPQALAFTTQVYKNVRVLPRDSREATDVFFQKGQGDALLTYEQEVILAGLRGQPLPYVVPDPNISIDNPVAVVDATVERKGTRAVAEAFVNYLFTPEAQRAFAEVGFRPVEPTVAQEFAWRYPPIEKLVTVADLGGWEAIQNRFFADGAVFDRIQAGL
ncbi:sulfate ABC transporter substrate-binding protein [Synechococcus sp. B60.1]|uniref:sulfate ABC transporter substrate-binding protein n=1 Tax=Synechococcus sp. B60.1 TaxID=2964522 RepID=UPI0039C0224B